MTNISQIYQKLIGVSCLKDTAEKRVKAVWEERFRQSDAFWVNADGNEPVNEIARKIFDEISLAGYGTLAGESFVLALFLDLSDGQSLRLSTHWDELAQQISFTGGSVSCVIQFGDLGRVPYDNASTLRENAEKVLQANNHKLCLVAAPALSVNGGNSWKAAMLLLDVLRRSLSPGTVISGGKVGFLRYGEYDHEKLTACQAKLAEIQERLSDRGDLEVRRCLNNSLEELEEDGEKRFIINSKAQPLHPGLVVEGMFEKKKAARNRSVQYNSAREQSSIALKMTGDRLVSQIREAFSLDEAAANKALDRLFAQANAGINFMLDESAVGRALSVNDEAVRNPDIPAFLYSEQDKFQEQIGRYLQGRLERGLYEAKKDRVGALKEAYARRLPEYPREKEELEEQRQLCANELGRMIDRQGFLQMVAGAGARMEACFNPVAGTGRTDRFILCRQTSDQQLLKQYCGNDSYYISEQDGGLRSLDDAEIKAIHACFFNLDNTILQYMIF